MPWMTFARPRRQPDRSHATRTPCHARVTRRRETTGNREERFGSTVRVRVAEGHPEEPPAHFPSQVSWVRAPSSAKRKARKDGLVFFLARLQRRSGRAVLLGRTPQPTTEPANRPFQISRGHELVTERGKNLLFLRGGEAAARDPRGWSVRPGMLPAQCRRCPASSCGRDHIGQWLVGRSTQLTSRSSARPATNA